MLTEFAYLQLKLAVAEPASTVSRQLLDEGFDLLGKAIYARCGVDPHQYHIYGRQGLAWMRRGDVTAAERDGVLRDITQKAELGRREHPRNDLLRDLLIDIQNVKLGIFTDS